MAAKKDPPAGEAAASEDAPKKGKLKLILIALAALTLLAAGGGALVMRATLRARRLGRATRASHRVTAGRRSRAAHPRARRSVARPTPASAPIMGMTPAW